MGDGTCKTCKWWTGTNDDPSGAHRTCTCPKVVFAVLWDGGGVGNSMRLIRHDQASEMEPDLSPLEPDSAAVMDGSGFFAALVPGPDFGCIHHEAKEES